MTTYNHITVAGQRNGQIDNVNFDVYAVYLHNADIPYDQDYDAIVTLVKSRIKIYDAIIDLVNKTPFKSFNELLDNFTDATENKLPLPLRRHRARITVILNLYPNQLYEFPRTKFDVPRTTYKQNGVILPGIEIPPQHTLIESLRRYKYFYDATLTLESVDEVNSNTREYTYTRTSGKAND